MGIFLILGCAFIYVDPSVADLVKEKYHNKYCCPKVFVLDSSHNSR